MLYPVQSSPLTRMEAINLICGVMEIGSGVKTGLAQILAERMNMEVDKIHVQMEVNTESSPQTLENCSQYVNLYGRKGGVGSGR